MSEIVVITDTSVLINFLVIDGAGLLGKLSTHRFLVTEHVRAEITAHYHEQLTRLELAFLTGVLEEVRVDNLKEVQLFADLASKGLGIGESSAIAVAAHRQWAIAIDDKQAIRRVSSLGYTMPILSTEALMVALIQCGAISIEEADSIKSEWEKNHRFRLAFPSFKDCI